MLLVLTGAIQLAAQDLGYTERARLYISQYATLAMLQQQKSGIPASITLGQGILETEAGASELMLQANNHFGIKCKNGWCGPTFTHTDDAEDECFKKYGSAEESFNDHSNLLKTNPRYAPLFKISETDYQGWARCLKKCGYATNPRYAERLIQIIEDFKLQEFTYTALDSSLMHKQPSPSLLKFKSKDTTSVENEPASTAKDGSPTQVTGSNPDVTPEPKIGKAAVPAKLPVLKADSTVAAKAHPITPGPVATPKPAPPTQAPARPEPDERLLVVHGLKAIQAYKDDMPMKYAMKYNIVYQQLLAHNDLADGPLPATMYLYLEKKLLKGENARHIVRPGENMQLISQEEGVQLKSLLDFNLMDPNDQPLAGSVIELQKSASVKPACVTRQITAHARNSIVLGPDNVSSVSGDFVPVSELKAVATAAPAATSRSSAPSPVAGPVAAPDSATGSNRSAPANNLQKTSGQSNLEHDTTTGNYVVRKGDTAFSIAKRNNISLDQLTLWNHIDATNIKVGQRLKIKPQP